VCFANEYLVAFLGWARLLRLRSGLARASATGRLCEKVAQWLLEPYFRFCCEMLRTFRPLGGLKRPNCFFRAAVGLASLSSPGSHLYRGRYSVEICKSLSVVFEEKKH
jgi:hypothetical protein